MPTPSIQTLRADAQQVLNLDSISAVRSVVAATLANANAGTPLNPNLTTQQLWNEFYQIVTQPKSDIESIIANQLMKFLYAPPAPGGAGADKQVIFNDGGVLAGDSGLTFNKTTDLLTVGSLIVPGNVQLATVSTLYVGTLLNPKLKVDVGGTGVTTITEATITGDLTVDTSTLKVDSTNNRVGIGTASPAVALDVVGAARFVAAAAGPKLSIENAGGSTRFKSTDTSSFYYSAYDHNFTNTDGSVNRYTIDNNGVSTWYVSGTTAMTLNSAGLGVGTSPSALLHVQKSQNSETTAIINNTNTGTSAGVRLDLQSNSSNYLTLQSYGQNYSGNAFGIAAAKLNVISENSATAFSSGLAIGTTSSNPLYFATSNAVKMTLDASGNLLVGTNTMPSGVTFARLVAKSTSGDWSGVIWNSNATPYGVRIQHDTDSNGTGNEFLICLGAGNLRASIRSNGGIANYQANDVSLSDSRIKTDIKPLASYWNKIKSLELVTFKYKDQTHSDDNIGLIAQQVESVAPELVDVDGFGETPDDGVPLKTIYTTDLYHAAIKALQEAMTRIEALESKLA